MVGGLLYVGFLCVGIIGVCKLTLHCLVLVLIVLRLSVFVVCCGIFDCDLYT